MIEKILELTFFTFSNSFAVLDPFTISLIAGAAGIGGSALAGGFKKRRAPSIDLPDFPTQGNLFFTDQLRNLASGGIRAAGGDRNVPGIGFGKDFVSRVTNPVIVDRTRRFNEQTLPNISNRAEERGLGRSNQPLIQERRAGRDFQNDLDKLVSQFFLLDELRRKTDTSERLGIATGLQTQQADLLSQRARGEERVRDLTLGRAERFNAQDVERRNTIFKTAGSFANFLGGAGGGGLPGGGLSTGQTLPDGTPITTPGAGNIPFSLNQATGGAGPRFPSTAASGFNQGGSLGNIFSSAGGARSATAANINRSSSTTDLISEFKKMFGLA